MNELRMYVEHLFEGKTMTAELIELKEEIYGNLVARYEDYLSEGFDSATALERTKESITSVDEVLDGDGSSDDAGESDAPAEGKPGACSDEVAPAPQDRASGDVAAASIGKAKSRKKWPFIVAGIFVIGFLLVVLGMPLMGILLYDIAFDGGQSAVDRVQVVRDGASADADDGIVTIASDGTIRLDGEPADDLMGDVVNSSVPSSYAGSALGDSSQVSGLAGSMPLGTWLTQASADAANGRVSLRYEGVPDRFDGDSVDAAMVYSATAVLSCLGDAQQVQIDISESDDPTDFDHYVFTRENLERAYGQKLDATVLDDAAWTALKEDHLYQGGFVEQLVDAAEKDWM